MREILISESAWEEMTCLFAPSLAFPLSLAILTEATRETSKEQLVICQKSQEIETKWLCLITPGHYFEREEK
ncbi:hypothetical protein [Klebsiella pneumoniae]|uniref:hypothetical protein n=1 Tax=Klebsiella pneumoniae TaxID=573 RepID=UPI0033406FFD